MQNVELCCGGRLPPYPSHPVHGLYSFQASVVIAGYLISTAVSRINILFYNHSHPQSIPEMHLIHPLIQHQTHRFPISHSSHHPRHPFPTPVTLVVDSINRKGRSTRGLIVFYIILQSRRVIHTCAGKQDLLVSHYRRLTNDDRGTTDST